MLPMTDAETPEGLHFLEVRGELGAAQFLPCEGWVRLVDQRGEPTAMPEQVSANAAQVYRLEGAAALRRLLNGLYAGLESVII